jgi:hypothetical protein
MCGDCGKPQNSSLHIVSVYFQTSQCIFIPIMTLLLCSHAVYILGAVRLLMSLLLQCIHSDATLIRLTLNFHCLCFKQKTLRQYSLGY